jgi:hypothetical protein
VYAYFFQGDRLADKHHRAPINTIKTVKIAITLAQVFKSRGERKFLPYFGHDSGKFMISVAEVTPQVFKLKGEECKKRKVDDIVTPTLSVGNLLKCNQGLED